MSHSESKQTPRVARGPDKSTNETRHARSEVVDGKAKTSPHWAANPGPSLRTLLQRSSGKLPPLRAMGIVLQAAEGVAAAHAQQILHRDVAPEHLLIAEHDLGGPAQPGGVPARGDSGDGRRSRSTSFTRRARDSMRRRPLP